jgi:hypothetical protein
MSDRTINEVTIDLTEEQRAQIKRVTGKAIDELTMETTDPEKLGPRSERSLSDRAPRD